MKKAVFLSTCCLWLSVSFAAVYCEKINRDTDIIANTYWVPLDHFTPTDSRRVELIYESNPEFYESGSPIFVYINDGAGIRWITSGLVYDLARELRAGLVTSHNRFFGLNTFINTTNENLRYLTFDNMLADVAQFVTQVREDYEAPNAPIIIWGTRMGATTAALAKKKFPHLINGAWASSGLFRAYLPETTYYSSVSDHFYRHGSPECASNLNNILNEIRELVEASNGDRLSELFRLCDPINFNDTQSVTFFYVNIFRFIASHVERNHYTAIQQICRDITVGSDPLLAFIRWIDYEFYTDGCRNINYDRWILQRHDTDARNMGRSTTWYYCTQNAFDFFVTSTESGMFPDVVDETYYDRLCEDTFGPPYNWTALHNALNNFNVQHGAQNQVIRNTIFSNGNLDPMLAHGMYEHHNFASEIVSTGLYGMEADLESISVNDAVSLRAAKEAIVSALQRFALETEGIVENNDNKTKHTTRKHAKNRVK